MLFSVRRLFPYTHKSRKESCTPTFPATGAIHTQRKYESFQRYPTISTCPKRKVAQYGAYRMVLVDSSGRPCLCARPSRTISSSGMLSSAIRGRVLFGSTAAWTGSAVGGSTRFLRWVGAFVVGRVGCSVSRCERRICDLVGPAILPRSVFRGGRFSRLNVQCKPFRAQCEQDGSFVRLHFWAWVHYSYQSFVQRG